MRAEGRGGGSNMWDVEGVIRGYVVYAGPGGGSNMCGGEGLVIYGVEF